MPLGPRRLMFSAFALTLLAPGIALAAQAPAPGEPAPADPAAGAATTPPPGEPLPEAAPAAEAPPPEAPKPKPPPYSIPWQLRPTGVANVIRSDTTLGFYKPDGATKGGNIIASMLLASYKVTPDFAPLIRLGVVNWSPSEPPAPGAEGKFNFLNPVVGGTYSIGLAPGMKLGLFLGLALPLGSGGGNRPDDPAEAKKWAERRAAMVPNGILNRSAMDNAMFASNYFTVFPGVGLSYSKSGFTVQGEVTVLALNRVKGKESGDPDVPGGGSNALRLNLTSGLHVGYQIIPELSIGAELRHQQWMKNASIPESRVDRNNTTIAIGPRAHFKLGETMWFRPGIAYARGLDKPMSGAGANGGPNPFNMHIVQLDLPFSF